MKNVFVTSAFILDISLVATGSAVAQLSADPNANPPSPARPPATAQQNPTTPPEVIVPPGSGGGHTGVLHPPANVDPGMKVQPPAGQQFPMPVIPPPGTTGGAQRNSVPK